MKKFILFGLLSLFLTACASSDDSTTIDLYNPEIAPQNENQILNLSYGDDPQQKMDLYLPKGRKTDVTKVFILIHGGGWYLGDKSEFNNEVQILKAGFPDYAIANVNYRLGTKESLGFPKQINDIEKIVTFLNSRYADFHIAKEYAMVGISAGAHLAMLYSYKYNTNNQVKAVCSIVGPADFSDPEYAGNELFVNGLNYVVGDEYPTYNDNPSIYNQISPVKQITSKSPKTIMFYGNTDPLVPRSQGQLLHQKLNSKRVYNEIHQYDAGHADWTTEQYSDINAKTISFFKTNF